MKFADYKEHGSENAVKSCRRLPAAGKELYRGRWGYHLLQIQCWSWIVGRKEEVIKLRKSFLLNDNKNWFIGILSKLQMLQLSAIFFILILFYIKKFNRG